MSWWARRVSTGSTTGRLTTGRGTTGRLTTGRLTAGALLLVLLVAPFGAAAGAAVRPLPTGADVDYQLGGNRPVPASVGIVARDRTEKPLAGVYNVCYVNGFQTQPGESRFWKKRPGLVLRKNGRPVVDEAWGEKLLDTRTAAKRKKLAKIVGRWMTGCARVGFDAVELDNLDSFSRSRGLITRKDNKRFAALLVTRAHRAGLAVGQKNWASWNGRSVGFDFAVAEECGRYAECGRYVKHYGNQVLAIEYRQADFARTCAAYGDLLPVVLRDRDLSPTGRRAFC